MRFLHLPVVAVFSLLHSGCYSLGHFQPECRGRNNEECPTVKQSHLWLTSGRVEEPESRRAPLAKSMAVAPKLQDSSSPKAVWRTSGLPPQKGSEAKSEGRYIAPERLRIWVNSWVDGTGDLRGEQYIQVVLDRGHWYIDPGHLVPRPAVRP